MPSFLTFPWYAWIAIVAIIGGALTEMFKRWTTHRERMAMIQMGMNPDKQGSPLLDENGKPAPEADL
jgi:hypothetical protein